MSGGGPHPAVQHRFRGPRVEGLRRHGDGFPQPLGDPAPARRPGGGQRGPRRQQHRVADRAPLPAGEQPSGHLRVVRGVGAPQGVGRGERDAEVAGVEGFLPDPSPSTLSTVEVLVTLSSSSPSSPRNTRALVPLRASTPAMSGSSRASATPTAWAVGRAGLVSGPRALKTVGIPNCLRTGEACRIEGWKSGAKQKVIPASSTSAATRAGGRRRVTPSASSTSADPEAELDALLPCLTTRAPAPAATIADMVEMLTVRAPSPPVPTTSTVAPGTSRVTAWSSRARTRPSSSPTVSPLPRRATRKPASWASVASPRMTWCMAQPVSA